MSRTLHIVLLFTAICFATNYSIISCTPIDSLENTEEDQGNTPDPENPEEDQDPDDNSGGTGDGNSDSNQDIADWEGERADDASLDIPGTDEDIYWEANDFSNTVVISYSGASATVTTSSDDIIYDISGAYVTLDMQTNAVKNVEVLVSGKTTDGGLKIYSGNKLKLTLAGTDITSTKGPAFNSQCKKRIFVHLEEGTTNRFTDTDSYSDDSYYISGSSSADEDRKGCFFSEGNLIFSGTGVLVVRGLQKHGLATDGYFRTRPGVTVAITDAAKNAIHVKGDADEGLGVIIDGGLIYASVSSTAGKAIKTDVNVDISGGRLLLSTSGGSEYDSDDNDTSSSSCIKTDGNVTITDGILTLTSTGEGGKGINADGSLTIHGGITNVKTSGGKFIYNEALDLTSSPKGVKADGDIIINGGELNIEVSGISDGSEGLESKSTITINNGDIYIHAYDDAMNATNDITINGGRVYCFSQSNDGIDSNGTLNVNGGLAIASGTTAPEEGFDCDNSNLFCITGGTLIGTGGAAVSPSAASSTQNTLIYNGLQATAGQLICLQQTDGTPIMIYELPRTMSGMSLLFSSPQLEGSETFTLLSGGNATGSAWNGWYSDASWSGGSELGTFTLSGTVTTIGNSGGGPGGEGGWNPGGGRPW